MKYNIQILGISRICEFCEFNLNDEYLNSRNFENFANFEIQFKQ